MIPTGTTFAQVWHTIVQTKSQLFISFFLKLLLHDTSTSAKTSASVPSQNSTVAATDEATAPPTTPTALPPSSARSANHSRRLVSWKSPTTVDDGFPRTVNVIWTVSLPP